MPLGDVLYEETGTVTGMRVLSSDASGTKLADILYVDRRSQPGRDGLRRSLASASTAPVWAWRTTVVRRSRASAGAA